MKSDYRYIWAAVIFVAIWCSHSNAQPEVLWTATYGSVFHDYDACVHPTPDGGYVVTGSYSHDQYNTDMWIQKADANGMPIWGHTYGGLNFDACECSEPTQDGGYILVGHTFTFGGGCDDVWLIKTDENGDSLWSRIYGGGLWDKGLSVRQTSDGGYIIAGTTESYGEGSLDAWLIRTDSSGDSLWTRTFGGIGMDAGVCVQETEDGGYVVAGYTESDGTGWRNLWLFKTDEDGTLVWEKTFGGNLWDVGEYVIQTVDGCYIIAGKTESLAVGMTDVWVIKTDQNGDSLWNRTYGGDLTDKGYCVKTTADSGYVIAASTWSYGEGESDVWIIRIDSQGDLLWDLTCGGIYNEHSHFVSQLDDGGYAVLGSTESFGSGEMDLYLLRLDVDPPWVGPSGHATPYNFQLFPPYPNPFNPTTIISFDLPVASMVDLKVFDIYGRNVGEGFKPAQYQPGTHQITFDGSNLASGVYIYRLKTGEFTASGKMVLMK